MVETGLPDYMLLALRWHHITRILLKRKPELIIQCDPDGNTLLHHASTQGYADTVAQLLALNADPTRLNAANQTPLECARARGRIAAIRLLEALNPEPEPPTTPEAAELTVETPPLPTFTWVEVEEALSRAYLLYSFEELNDLIRQGLLVWQDQVAWRDPEELGVILINALLPPTEAETEQICIRWLAHHPRASAIIATRNSSGDTAQDIARKKGFTGLTALLQSYCDQGDGHEAVPVQPVPGSHACVDTEENNLDPSDDEMNSLELVTVVPGQHYKMNDLGASDGQLGRPDISAVVRPPAHTSSPAPAQDKDTQPPNNLDESDDEMNNLSLGAVVPTQQNGLNDLGCLREESLRERLREDTHRYRETSYCIHERSGSHIEINDLSALDDELDPPAHISRSALTQDEDTRTENNLDATDDEQEPSPTPTPFSKSRKPLPHQNPAAPVDPASAFVTACEGRDFSSLLQLIDSDLHCTDPQLDCCTLEQFTHLLCSATLAGQQQVVEWLITHPHIKTIARNGWQQEFMPVLLDGQPAPETALVDKDAALHIAVRHQYYELVRLLQPVSNPGRLNSKSEMAWRMMHHDQALMMWLYARKHDLDPDTLPWPVTEAIPGTRIIVLSDAEQAQYRRFREINTFCGTRSTDRLLSIAVKMKDIAAIRGLLATRHNDDSIKPKGYDSVVYCSIDTDGDSCLQGSYSQFKNDKGAYLVLLKQPYGCTELYEESVVYGQRSLTRKSKVVITGHGPNIAGRTGAEFAHVIHQWLNEHDCLPYDTPSITLCSCHAGGSQVPAEQLYATFGERRNIGWLNFAHEFTETLATLDRYPRVTATPGLVMITSQGLTISVLGTETDVFVFKATHWQGDSNWLDNPVHAMEANLTGITPENYRHDLIVVFEYDPVTATITKRLKHDQGMGGLSSRMPRL
ncbi:hypothetical protein [Spongorhabdus nitratireducens]